MRTNTRHNLCVFLNICVTPKTVKYMSGIHWHHFLFIALTLWYTLLKFASVWIWPNLTVLFVTVCVANVMTAKSSRSLFLGACMQILRSTKHTSFFLQRHEEWGILSGLQTPHSHPELPLWLCFLFCSCTKTWCSLCHLKSKSVNSRFISVDRWLSSVNWRQLMARIIHNFAYKQSFFWNFL